MNTCILKGFWEDYDLIFLRFVTNNTDILNLIKVRYCKNSILNYI